MERATTANRHCKTRLGGGLREVRVAVVGAKNEALTRPVPNYLGYKMESTASAFNLIWTGWICRRAESSAVVIRRRRRMGLSPKVVRFFAPRTREVKEHRRAIYSLAT